MSETGVSGIPAGWYPDPLGLPQRRWWDSTAWTQDVVAIPARSGPDGAVSAPTASAESGATTTTTLTAECLVPAEPVETEATREPAATGIGHAYVPTALRTPVQFRPQDGPIPSNTLAVWLLALLPAVQLVTVLALIFALSDFGRFMQAAVGVIFFLGNAVLATSDKKALLAAGHQEAASAWWLLLSPLAYLIARTVHVRKQAHHGSAPLWTYLVLSAVPVLASIVLLLQAGGPLDLVLRATAH